MRLSVELVPRSSAALSTQLDEVKSLGRVDTVNVPDLAQFEIRGWQAAALARRAGAWRAVPHLRAQEVMRDCDAGWQALFAVLASGVDEVLVVSGDEAISTDWAPGTDRHDRGTPALAAISALKGSFPDLTVYAALDPYRTGFAAELAYAEAKLAAGADGLFTQPFFDMRLLAVWQELTAGTPVFWGVTSVTSSRSQGYWLSRNRAIFPAGFEPTLEWHKTLAARALERVEGSSGNLYFMPIKVSVSDWLGDLLR